MKYPQGKEVKRNFDRESIYKVDKMGYIPKGCTEAINTVCGVCPKMTVKQIDDNRTLARCSEKFWLPSYKWNPV